MDRKINLAALLCAFIALATYVWLGWNLAGAPAAARNTARFSSLIFALAFAVHSHPRWGHAYRTAFLAFVAAHGVHYATVIAYHVLLGQLFNPMFIAGAALGGALLLAAALTITRMPRFHRLLSFVIWAALVFALSSRFRAHWLPEAPIVALLALAMAARIGDVWKARPRKTQSASA